MIPHDLFQQFVGADVLQAGIAEIAVADHTVYDNRLFQVLRMLHKVELVTDVVVGKFHRYRLLS